MLAVNPDDAYDVVALNAASASTMISGLPFEGPVSGVRLALIDGQWVAFPRWSERERAVFEIVVAGRVVENGDVAIAMIEAGAGKNAWHLIYDEGQTKPDEEVVAGGLEAAKPFIKVICEAQAELKKIAAKETKEFQLFPEYTEDLYNRIDEIAHADLDEALSIAEKLPRQDRIHEIKEGVKATLAGEFTDMEDAEKDKEIGNAFKELQRQIVRRRILTQDYRIDGRGLRDIRTLSAEVDIVPRVHGSALFQRGETQTPNNRKQAMVPVHGHKVVNHHGTAPGAWFEQDGHCAVLMPGVPHEMKAMWEESVRPLLLARQSCALHSLTLRVLGGESNLEYRVRALLENPNPTAAIYCKTGECEIRITARAQNDAEAQTMCRAYAKKFYDLLGDAVYDEDVAGLEETVVHTLQANGLTIATAESCTGGMIAQRLTSVSGASEVFGYGFVTYWEQAKAKLVGVDPAVIAQYNVVSAPVAAQMALGAAKAAGADIAVSVTGLAGPDGGDAVRPVGTVYLGAARGDKAYVKKLFVSRPDRALIRARAAQTALEMALRLAQGKTPAGTQVLAESAQHDPAALTALDETLRAE